MPLEGGGLKTLWSTLTGLKGNPGLVTCVCVCVAGLATGLFRFIHTRTIAHPQRLTELHAGHVVFGLFRACAASPVNDMLNICTEKSKSTPNNEADTATTLSDSGDEGIRDEGSQNTNLGQNKSEALL